MLADYQRVPTECTPQPADVGEAMTAAHIPMSALSSEPGVRKRVGSATGVDMEPEEYLEPTASLPRRPKGNQHKPQYDSGVSDMDAAFHPSPDPIGFSNGGLPGNHATAPLGSPQRVARPDSLAKGPHLYEELPARYANPRLQHEFDPSKMAPRSTPAPAFSKASLVSSPNPSSTENLFRNSNHSNTSLPSQHQATGAQTPYGRKRENPLYEEGSQDDLKPSNRGWLAPPCLGILLVLYFAFALLTFVLVLLLLTGFLPKEQPEVIGPMTGALSGDEGEDIHRALHQLTQLEASYADLIDKHALLLGNLSSVQSVIGVQSEQIATLTSQVSTLQAQLASMEDTINVQFGDNGVSTLVGPPGPPGPAANFSSCQHLLIQRGSSANAPFVQTTWWPDTEDALNNIVMGLECTTDIGNSSFVQSQEHPEHPEVTQYRCECRGTDSSSTVRYCLLHVWHCPRTAT